MCSSDLGQAGEGFGDGVAGGGPPLARVVLSGKGVKKLQDTGIEVVTGIEENSIKELNKVFLKFIKTRRPYVLMKYAMTMDGKIASCSGDSKWITCEASRQAVHTLRSEMMGIVVGRGTVAADDPMLNCRLDGQPHQPIRIVIDGKVGLSPSSRLAQTATEYRTIVADDRSEERRVGKECRSRWSPYH